MGGRRTARALLVVSAVFVVTAAIVAWVNVRGGGALLRYDKGEVHVYNLAAERLLDGAEIYRARDYKPFTYPPFMAVLFVPFACLDHGAVRPLWYACNFVMLLWVLAWIVQLVSAATVSGGAGRGRHVLAWLATAALAGRHVASPLENQSNDFLVLFAVVLGVRASARERWRVAGVWFGLGAAVKATPLLFLPYLLFKRRFGAALVMVLAIAAAFALTEICFAREDGGLWIGTWCRTFVGGIDPVGGNAEQVGNAWNAWNIRNQNLANMIYRFFTPVAPFANHTFDVSFTTLPAWQIKYLTFACQLVLVSFLAWWLRPRPKHDAPGEPGDEGFRRLAEGGVVVCGMVLLSPMSSKSHFCVLLLPIALACREYFLRRRGAMLLGCLLVLLGGTFTANGIVGPDIGYAIQARGSVTWCAFAAMLAAAIVLGRMRRATPSCVTDGTPR